MNTERKAKFDAQTNDLYRAYGCFAVQFEHMCLRLRGGIMLFFNGRKDQTFARILLADQTADPLIKKYRAFVAIFYKDKPSEIKHIEQLFKFCILINERRNEIIHGTWFIGWASEEQTEFSMARGVKEKITKNGMDQVSLNHSAENFDGLTEEIKKVTDLIMLLNAYIGSGDLPSKLLDMTNIDLTKIKR